MGEQKKFTDEELDAIWKEMLKPEKRNPLTLEELRSMANKPYWHVGLREDSGAPHWSILDPLLAYHPEDYDYGKTFLAYAYEPPRLDRSAWEPCEHCGENAELTKEALILPLVNSSLYFFQNETWNHVEINFCPWCSRPLNKEAWKMLEKRLGINEE